MLFIKCKSPLCSKSWPILTFIAAGLSSKTIEHWEGVSGQGMENKVVFH